jgi:hypothetical protein
VLATTTRVVGLVGALHWGPGTNHIQAPSSRSAWNSETAFSKNSTDAPYLPYPCSSGGLAGAPRALARDGSRGGLGGFAAVVSENRSSSRKVRWENTRWLANGRLRG